jgi:fructokinase
LLARLDERGLLDRHHIAALDKDAVADVVLVAAAAAAITCTRRGADPPRTPELRAAMDRPFPD